MKHFKVLVLSTTMISSLFIFSKGFAAQLDVNADFSLSNDETYSGNAGSYGIISNSSSGSNPLKIDTNGHNITSDGNTGGLNVTGTGNLQINGSGSNNLTISNNTGNNALLNQGKLEINEMNINISGNPLIGNANGIDNIIDATLNIIGSINGSNDLNILNNNSPSGWAYNYGINNKGTTNIKYMDVNIEGINTTGGLGATIQNHGISNSGTMNIEGVANGTNTLSITNVIGVNAYSHGIQNNGTINITNMDVITSNNKTANGAGDNLVIGIQNFGNITMNTSNIKTNTWQSNGNVGKVNAMGVYNPNSIVINGMNVELSGNVAQGGYGAGIGSDTLFQVNGNSSGTNTIKANNNQGTTFAIGIANQNGGSINIYNTNIEANYNIGGSGIASGINNTGSGGFIISGLASGVNTLSIIGNNTTGTGNAYGIYSNKAFNISNMDITIKDTTSANGTGYGIYTFAAPMNITGSNIRRNKMVLENNKTVGLYTGTNSTTNITNMDIVLTNNNFAMNNTGAQLNLDNVAVSFTDNSSVFYGGDNTNFNIKNNSSVVSNGGLLIASHSTNTWTTNLNVDASSVSGIINNTGASTIKVNLANASTWNILETSVVKELKNDASTINLRNATAGSYNVLTVNNYVGTGGNVYMNTALGNDSSATDKIVVNNTATGTTNLYITDTGSGSGAETIADGIKVVEVNGAATIDAGAFVLAGGQVDTSAYIYKLYQGDINGLDTQSYFLRSTRSLSDIAKAIANEPTTILSLSRTGMNILQKRMGELRENNPDNKNGVWVRAFAKDLKVKGSITTDMEIYGTEAGYDHRWDFDGYKVYLGGTVGYLNVDNIKNNQTNGARDGAGNGYAPSVGLYATVLAKNGWFIDGVVRNFWEDLKLTAYSSTGVPIVYRPDRMITAYSLEVGKQYKYCLDCNTMFVIEPKVEFMYAHANAKSFLSNLGTDIRYGHTNSYNTKASLMLGYKKKLDNGSIIEPFMRLGIAKEWDGDTNVVYTGTHYKSEQSSTSYELGGGFNAQVTRDVSFYSDIMYETGSYVQSISGNIGVRYTW